MNQVGKASEELAVEFLLGHGHSILERNFSCRYGEIDIISYDGAVVFSEVKMRSGHSYGGASAAVTKTKQQKFLKPLGYTYNRTRSRRFMPADSMSSP